MAEIATGTFTHWKLNKHETIAGSILTLDQKYVIQNDLATIAEQKLALTFDAKDPTKFAQDEAFLSGQMSVLNLLLVRSNECANLINPASQQTL